MKNYEMMVIFTPILSQDEYKVEAKRITTFIEENSGKIESENFWGLRQLAYPIQKKTTALYYVLEFTAETDLNEKILVQMNRTDAVMRQMITALDKHAVAYNTKKRGGGNSQPKEIHQPEKVMEEKLPTETPNEASKETPNENQEA